MVGRVVLAALIAAGCAKASEEQKAARRTPALPPPPLSASVPSNLSIAVTIDGAPAPPITAERLRDHKPDFEDAERRAWRLTRLLPELAQPGAVAEARGPSGISLRLPVDAKGVELVLFLTRRGDVVVAAVDPTNPFPDYHGQGDRLRRPGDPMPRLSPVSSIAVVR